MEQNTYRAAGEMLREQTAELAEIIVTQQYLHDPSLMQRYGTRGRDLAVRDAKYLLRYLAEALLYESPILFSEYIAWAKVLFTQIALPLEIFAQTLRDTQTVLAQRLPPALADVASEYLAIGSSTLAQAAATIPSFFEPTSPLARVGERYLHTLLLGDRHAAMRLVLAQIEDDVSIPMFYLEVLQRAQYEIGRLWQMNQISVAQEHFCSAVTQLVMAQLYPRIFSSARRHHRMVVACASGELHEIGARMVADLCELDGWDTYYLGANTPAAGILRALEEQQADALAISVTMTYHLPTVATLIERALATPRGRQLIILVGGYPFRLAPNLWQQLHADGWASDAQRAVQELDRLIETKA